MKAVINNFVIEGDYEFLLSSFVDFIISKSDIDSKYLNINIIKSDMIKEIKKHSSKHDEYNDTDRNNNNSYICGFVIGKMIGINNYTLVCNDIIKPLDKYFL
jgi:hypothetical protein